jgi:hypothetical protein
MAKILAIIFGLVLLALIAAPIIIGVIQKYTVPEGTCSLNAVVCSIGATMGIPGWFLQGSNMIWYLLLPLALVGIVVYGFLDKLRIFSNTGINIALAIIIALILIPAKLYTILVAGMMAVLGTYSVAAFGIVFVLGVFYVSLGSIGRIRAQYTPESIAIDRNIAKIKNEMKKIDKAQGAYRGMSPAERAENKRRYVEELAKAEGEKQNIEFYRKQK